MVASYVEELHSWQKLPVVIYHSHGQPLSRIAFVPLMYAYFLYCQEDFAWQMGKRREMVSSCWFMGGTGKGRLKGGGKEGKGKSGCSI